jgi:hypothetical protein
LRYCSNNRGALHVITKRSMIHFCEKTHIKGKNVNERIPNIFTEPEQDMKPNFIITQIIQGFEYGHGKISGEEASGVLKIMDDTLRYSPDILVPIDRDDEGNILDDDGCGDGRGVGTVFSRDRHYKRSLNRAKAFGGSVVMATATRIGLGLTTGESLNDDFNQSIDVLIDHDIDFGAHTDEHAHGPNCGCGAIDKAPEILLAVAKYEIPIRGTISFLGIDMDGIDDIYRNFRSYASNSIARQTEYSGKKVMDRIIDEAKVVKQLSGEHKEKSILLNMVRGFTANQELVRSNTDEQAQIFAVDVWRLQDLVSDLYRGDKKQQHKALLSELVYTLATAAVLTKGDLPVYIAQESSSPVTV